MQIASLGASMSEEMLLFPGCDADCYRLNHATTRHRTVWTFPLQSGSLSGESGKGIVFRLQMGNSQRQLGRQVPWPSSWRQLTALVHNPACGSRDWMRCHWQTVVRKDSPDYDDSFFCLSAVRVATSLNMRTKRVPSAHFPFPLPLISWKDLLEQLMISVF